MLVNTGGSRTTQKDTRRESSIQDDITEISKKIQLFEGSKRGYLERTQWTIQGNRENINRLRKENKQLHKTLMVALGVCESKKRLNALRGTSFGYKRQISEFESNYASMIQEMEGIAKDGRRNRRIFRQLENSLDKARLKLMESTRINKIYNSLLFGLKKESLYYHGQLLSQQNVLKDARKELNEIQTMYEEAQVFRDWMKNEMVQHEDSLYRKRYEQDVEINELQVEREVRKTQDESREKKLLQLLKEEMYLYEEMRKPRLSVAERQIKLENFEVLFAALFKTVGNCGTQIVSARFKAQLESHSRLIELKTENIQFIDSLESKLKETVDEYETLKYDEKEENLRWKDVLKDRRKNLKEIKVANATVSMNYQKNDSFLAKLKIALEHLKDIVKYLEKDERAHHTSFNDFLRPFFVFDSKITRLYGQCKKVMKKTAKPVDIKEDKYHSHLEQLFPDGNTRISSQILRRSHMNSAFDGEEDLKEDDVADPVRTLMKQKSLKLIEIKTKRRYGRMRM